MSPGLLRFLWILDFGGYRNGNRHPPLQDSAIGVSGAKKTPFHRLLWELFAVSLWDKASLVLMVPSKNSRLRPFSAECKEWASRYILPLFCYLYLTREVFPHKGECSPDLKSFPWSLYQHVDSVESIYCRAAEITIIVSYWKEVFLKFFLILHIPISLLFPLTHISTSPSNPV